jgi:hypothetical protein
MNILIIKKKIYKGYSSNTLSKAITIAIKLSCKKDSCKKDSYKDDLHKEIKLIDNMTKEDWNSMPIFI